MNFVRLRDIVLSSSNAPEFTNSSNSSEVHQTIQQFAALLVHSITHNEEPLKGVLEISNFAKLLLIFPINELLCCHAQ